MNNTKAITIGEVISSGHWEQLCKMRGWDVWAVNEGLMDSHEDAELTTSEIRNLLGIE